MSAFLRDICRIRRGGRGLSGFRVSLMARYRLYLMDGLGKIGTVEFLQAADDCEAVHLACEMRLSVSAEIWDRDRFVAGVPAACPEEVRSA